MSYDFDGPWVLLRDEKGQQMLREAEAAGHSSYKDIAPFFNKQIGHSFCGYASSACVLSALKITDGEVKEGDLAGNETLASEVYSPKKAEVDGMPLEMVEKIANFFGAEATFYPMKESDPQLLRSHLKQCVSDKSSLKQAMVVNFYCDTLQLKLPLGHISVAAAYHADTDSILVLDTYMITHSAWYSIDDMARAMNTFDSDADNYRGFVIVEKKGCE